MLFREGRKMIKAGNLEGGCAKIEASQRLEPSVGTALNLGDCREKLGNFASAWVAFRKAEALALQRGDMKRKAEAAKRAAVLEPKLSQLVVMVTSRIDGLVIKRGDEVIAAEAWNAPVPVDPGLYTITAEAPGYKTWSQNIAIAGSKLERKVVTVPMLERAPIKSPEKLAPTDLAIEPSPPPKPVEVKTPIHQASRWTTTRKVALGVGATGVLAGATGVYFGLRAKDFEDRSNELCPMTTCDDPEGLRLNDRAQTSARNANIAYAIGGVAVGTSIVLWFVGSPKHEVSISPNVGEDHAGVSIGGKW
jgi:hypothetical protein